MTVSSICLKEDIDGLHAFGKIDDLGQNVILAGGNGSGKTRLLKVLQRHVDSVQGKTKDPKAESALELEILIDGKNERYSREIALNKQIRIANYSHYDAVLQSPTKFTPYVICKARDLLRECDYEETALNSLLFIEDMAKGYSEELRKKRAFSRFTKKLEENFGLQISKDKKKKLKICGRDVDEARLSPGQQYLLRIAVACFCNYPDDNMIFVLDEPELHLHPKALLKLYDLLRSKFTRAQFWISTHSIALISYVLAKDYHSTIICMQKGESHLLKSDSYSLLSGLLGDDENRIAISQLLARPEEYASNRFAVQCRYKATVAGAGKKKDPQAKIIETLLHTNDLVVDFGAGKGRLLEELAQINLNTAKSIRYFAYDSSSKYADDCKKVMNKYGSSEKQYYNNLKGLIADVSCQAKYVFLVNVLHEIPPRRWCDLFTNIQKMLSEEGQLIIVEREELWIGEAPYKNGFLMLTENGAKALFGSENSKVERKVKPPNDEKYIIRFLVDRAGLSVKGKQVIGCIEAIRDDAYREVKDLKNCDENNKKADKSKKDEERYKDGLKMAFYSQQYVNSSLLIEEWGK